MNRRDWLGTASGTAFAALAAVSFPSSLSAQVIRKKKKGAEKSTLERHDNSFFYKDGKFDAAAGKQAFRELFKFHRYALPDVVDDERFWVVDFGLGDFANVGMGGIFWVNDKEHGYFGHEIYLLPFQMIPEHSHSAAEGKPAKHEYWQVRNGSIYNFSKGGSKDDPLPSSVTLPKSQLDANAISCFKWKELTPHTGLGKGEDVLSGIGDWHFMMGGANGAIVTEYASWHSGQGLKLHNPNAKM
ncbi:hypothetical protein FACS18942_08940 [Planctomycetales bacterium]|nr:hypothetical protein FACS18942_08940 [Planctomycetales bacterium]